METKEMVPKLPIMPWRFFKLGPMDIRGTGWWNLFVFVRWMDA